MKDMKSLVLELCKLTSEQTWVEFKHDNFNPEMIAKDISAIANAAVLEDREFGYMLWGVQNETHEILGTTHDLQTLKRGNEELENWLRQQISDNADFETTKVDFDGKIVLVLKIAAAVKTPVMFESTAFIRVGSLTKRLQEYPALEAKLWKCLCASKFELQSAAVDLGPRAIHDLLDVNAYFVRCKIPQPLEFVKCLGYLETEKIIKKQDNGLYTITNLGALLFARKLSAFPSVASKIFRVIRHDGDSRDEMLRSKDFDKGYAYSFEEGEQYVMDMIAARDSIVGAERKEWTAIPPKAVREALANMLVHRDMNDDVTGALVEVFDSRVELTNPGQFLIDVDRIVDNPPQARNPKLADLMRRMNFCEASGSGWDKIISSCEREHLPAPRIDKYPTAVKVVLFAAMPYGKINREDKFRAIYYHACIRYMISERLTNASLRERFGLKDSDAANLSRLIKEAVEKGLIKPVDSVMTRKNMSYIPYWA